MRAVTSRPPYAASIFYAIPPKVIETRSWAIKPGLLAIHCGRDYDDTAEEHEHAADVVAGRPRGVVLGSVIVTACTRVDGEYHWILTEPVLLDQPVPARGYPAIWRLRG